MCDVFMISRKHVYGLLLCGFVFERVGFNVVVCFSCQLLCDVVWFVIVVFFCVCVCLSLLFKVIGCGA